MRYYCSDAWDEWRHNPGVNVLAVITLASSLFIAGLVVLIVSNVEHRVRELRGDVRVDVYLLDDHTIAEREALVDELDARGDVTRVAFVDKATALERYRAWAADLADLVGELETNPLPASLEVYLVPGEGAAAAAESIARDLYDRTGVEQVQYNQAWLSRLESILELARVGGAALAALVFLAIVFVMASVLRLAVFRRREEIEIMQLVGATQAFIRGPFLVAGVAQGLIAAGLALAAVEAVRRSALAWAGGRSMAVVDLVAAHPVSLTLSLAMLGVGLVVSLASAWVAVRRAV
jgi:cell division transport system permease protein